MPVGSFVIATRPLSDAEAAETLPGNRTYVTSMNIGNYFRLAPDRRLIFGGRARFSARADRASDAQSGAILRRAMVALFPHLAAVEIDYCWGGLVDMTWDRLPRAGHAEAFITPWAIPGMAPRSPPHGEMIADRMLGWRARARGTTCRGRLCRRPLARRGFAVGRRLLQAQGQGQLGLGWIAARAARRRLLFQ